MVIYKHISGVEGTFYKRYRPTGLSYYYIMVKTFDGRMFYAPETEWEILKYLQGDRRMTKINHEEYKKIKLLPDYDWNWIAREKGGKIISFMNKPTKTDKTWEDKQMRLWFNYKDSQLFQFIQWEDKDPWNVQELIEEYEKEIEETEVKKDIKFSEELQEFITRAFNIETTSKTIEALTGMTLEQIAEEARNGGITPKQELLVVPNYVTEWISEHYKQFDLYPALKRLENNAFSWHDVYEWYRGNTRKFVNAYLIRRYEMEEELKYVIKLDDESYLQRYEIDNKNIVTPFRIVGHLKEVAIKFNDRKKAEKVAELVEGEVEELE